MANDNGPIHQTNKCAAAAAAAVAANVAANEGNYYTQCSYSILE